MRDAGLLLLLWLSFPARRCVWNFVRMDNYNAEVRQWGNDTLGDIKRSGEQHNIQHVARSPSPDSSMKELHVAFSRREGFIKRIAYKLRRHLIFVHKGVGKHAPAGSGKRKPKPIFDPVDSNIDRLADIVADHTGDQLSNSILT